MNYFSFCLLEKVFILSLYLKVIFTVMVFQVDSFFLHYFRDVIPLTSGLFLGSPCPPCLCLSLCT